MLYERLPCPAASLARLHPKVCVLCYNFNMVSSAPFHSAPIRESLSPDQIKIVKSTAPVLAEHGKTITSHFYKRMLDARPDLRNIFNSAHQSTGAQPAALAHAVWAYASNIDNPGALVATVSRIGHKHASLGVMPEHYPIVGEHLLASIKEVLGEAATQPIMDAWKIAYQQLADIFIGFEQNLYESSAHMDGGWNGWRRFKVMRKVPESDEITSFYLEPVDEGRLPTHQPGQYISIRLFVPELNLYQPRQYSLSESTHGNHLRVSVKREPASASKPAGRISNILHDTVSEGEEIDCSMPYGDFTLNADSDKPVVLISGGVGITPMLAMLDSLTENAKSRNVMFVHSCRSGQVHAMKYYITQVVAQNPQVKKVVFYEHIGAHDLQGVDFDFKGRLDLDKIKDQVILPEADYYLCGPVPFMQTQQKCLERLGVYKDKIHSEVFGSGIV